MKELRLSMCSTLLCTTLGSTSFFTEAKVCSIPAAAQDGCTLPSGTFLEQVFRGVAKPFRSVWEAQCNTHDRNYQILGKSKQSSDSDFYADMRKRCDSKFDKYLLAPLNQTCRAAAYSVYVALKNTSSSKYYTANQESRQINTSDFIRMIDNGYGYCEMTPEYAGFYDKSLLDYINITFKNITGRTPTAYERFELLGLYDVDQPLNAWKSLVVSEINNNLKFSSGPEVKLVNKYSLEEYKKDASSSLRADEYMWDLNIGTGNDSYFSKILASQYNESHRIYGTLKVADSNGNMDVKIIDETYISKGFCSPDESLQCF